jgi:hypothetical protein
MFIYQPYFYIIQEVSSGIYYAGIKYGKMQILNSL